MPRRPRDVELPPHRQRWVAKLSESRGAATILTKAVKHTLLQVSIKHFSAPGGRLNADGKVMFEELISAELPRVSDEFMPKIEVAADHEAKQYELLLNETYEHPTKGRMRVGQFTPNEIRDEVADKLRDQASTLTKKATALENLADRCPLPDQPIEDQLDKLKRASRRRPGAEDGDRPTA
jgi:hypothetical protein